MKTKNQKPISFSNDHRHDYHASICKLGYEWVSNGLAKRCGITSQAKLSLGGF